MIPSSNTSYVKVLNTIINKLIKQIIWEYKKAYYNLYKAKQKARKFNVSNKYILITYQIRKAFDNLYTLYSNKIIKIFQQISLSLNLDSSEDQKLKI